jgi:threonine/homoserine/homoserine lactone efflux protein
MKIKVPPAIHVAICALVLTVTLFSALAVFGLLFTHQPVPPELWKIVGGSLLGYLGLKATPDDEPTA